MSNEIHEGIHTCIKCKKDFPASLFVVGSGYCEYCYFIDDDDEPPSPIQQQINADAPGIDKFASEPIIVGTFIFDHDKQEETYVSNLSPLQSQLNADAATIKILMDENERLKGEIEQLKFMLNNN